MSHLLYFGTALLLGALHALEPGHGKTIVTAYTLGNRVGVWDAVKLGLIVTFTHTASIVILALIVIGSLSQFLPETLEKYMQLLSSLIVLILGISLSFGAIRQNPVGSIAHHHHDHEHDHSVNSSRQKQRQTSLLWLGVSGGIVPCHGALAVLLSSLAAGGSQSLLWALFMVSAFSLGIALVISSLALAAGRFKRMLADNHRANRLLTRLPLISGLIILALGSGMTFTNICQLQLAGPG